MKKSTVILVAAVFAVSVFVVGIFGLRSVPYNEIVYVESITPTAVTLSNGKSAEIRRTGDEYYVRIDYEKDLVVIVDYVITPNDATTRKIDVTMECFNKDPSATMTDLGVKLREKGNIKLTYRATDSASAPTMVMYIYTR